MPKQVNKTFPMSLKDQITFDIALRGSTWEQLLQKFDLIIGKTKQPKYNYFIISTAIGIMYDKQIDFTSSDEEVKYDVPRQVLLRHTEDLENLFQTAILTSSLVDLSTQERMNLAFNSDGETTFDKIRFLIKFANYGATILLSLATENAIESMDNILKFIDKTIGGYNMDIIDVDVSEDDLLNLDFKMNADNN